jgi:hypothetical protein
MLSLTKELARVREAEHRQALDRLSGYALSANVPESVAAAAIAKQNGWSHDLKEQTGNFQTICKHTARLIELSVNAGYELSSDRVVYLGHDLAEVIAIGEELNSIGGIDLMQAVASEIPHIDQRELDYAWDGIGEWLC